MQYLYYSALFILLYVFMGLGFTIILCPKNLKKYSIFFSPVVGYCYLTLMGWYAYSLDLDGTDIYSFPILIPPLFLLLFLLLWRQRRVTDFSTLLNKEFVAPLLVGVIVFLIISIPFIRSIDGLTSMSLGNNDIADSAGISRYLKEFPRSSQEGFLGQSAIFRINADQFIFGGPLSTAFFCTIFCLEPYQVQSMSLHIFFFFSSFLSYVLAREAFRYTQHAAIGVMALYGMNPIMYYTIYHGFQAQIAATGLALCVFMWNVHAISNCTKFSDYYPYIPLAVLFNFGFSLTYAHMLPFVYLLLVSYLALFNISTRRWGNAIRWFLFAMVTLIITFVLSPYRAKALLSMIFALGSYQGAWYNSLFYPEIILGLTTKNLYSQHGTNLLMYILRIPLYLIIVLGFINAYKKDRTLFYLAVSSMFVILTCTIILSFIWRTSAGWGGYQSYKLLSFFLPLLLLSLMLLFRNIKINPRYLTPYLLTFLFIVLIIWNIGSAFYVGIQMSKVHRKVTKDMADLKRIENFSEVDSINILGSDWWDILWQTNFLMRKKLYFETTTYAGRTRSKLEGRWDLLRSCVSDKNALPVNLSFVLKKVKRVSDGSRENSTGTTTHSPAIAVFNNRLYMAAKGAKNDNIYVCSMADTGAWNPWTKISGTTTHSPALSGFRKKANSIRAVPTKVNWTGNIIYFFRVDSITKNFHSTFSGQ